MQIDYEIKVVWNKGYMVVRDSVNTDSENYITELKEVLRKTYFSFLPEETHFYYEVLKWDVSFGDIWYDSLTSNEVFEYTKITKQQLHYYVKTGQIRQVFDPTGKFKRARYNKDDVMAVYANIIKIHMR